MIKNNNIWFHLSPQFTQKYVRQPFFLSYPQEIHLEDLPSSIVDIPLITNVIAVIWFSGQEYSIEEMDEDLYCSLIKIKEFFRRFFYNTRWDGELKPGRLVKNTLSPTNVRSAALFTGGLDSTTTFLRHWDERPLLISFNDPHRTAIDFAQRHQCDFCTIYMNHDSFLKLTLLDKASPDISKWFWDTSMSLSWVGVALPFLYSRGISQLYIPSGFTWRSFLFPDGQTLYQPASPLIDENLSPAGLRVFHDVFTMTRTEKIQFVSSFCREKKIPKPQLIVCTHHPKANTSYSNCNRCTKCLLTMLDIVAIGEEIQDYGFTLSEGDFIARFQTYMAHLTMRRGGTYVALRDTQNYLRQNIEILPRARRPFYDWFISLDFSEKLNVSSDRPSRLVPFSWSDYQDLYPAVKNFTD